MGARVWAPQSWLVASAPATTTWCAVVLQNTLVAVGTRYGGASNLVTTRPAESGSASGQSRVALRCLLRAVA